jgi:2-haloacid dehalogenase
LEGLLEHVISVEDAGVFKSAPRVYQLAVDKLGVHAKKVRFLSSNAWHAVGATRFGFRVVWVNRFGQCSERLPFEPQFEVQSLAELAVLLGRTLGV